MTRTMTVNRFGRTGGEEYTLRHPWPLEVFVQGGHNGVVIGEGKTYRTAYFEAFPGSFVRGEGETLEEAEDACWAKHQRHQACGEHEYEPRDFRNGAGFCKKCNHFKSHVFTGEELGQFCHTCGVGTTWTWVDDWFFCELHAPVRDPDQRYELDHPEEVSDEDFHSALTNLLDNL